MEVGEDEEEDEGELLLLLWICILIMPRINRLHSTSKLKTVHIS
jgi:hypothetical protein